MWASVDQEITGHELKGKTDWKFPAWAEGIFVTSGPSVREMGGRKVAHVLDGFARYSTVTFKDGKATLMSKMLNNKLYTESKR